MLYCNRTMIK